MFHHSSRRTVLLVSYSSTSTTLNSFISLKFRPENLFMAVQPPTLRGDFLGAVFMRPRSGRSDFLPPLLSLLSHGRRVVAVVLVEVTGTDCTIPHGTCALEVSLELMRVDGTPLETSTSMRWALETSLGATPSSSCIVRRSTDVATKQSHRYRRRRWRLRPSYRPNGGRRQKLHHFVRRTTRRLRPVQ